jgi:hypothetical protein
MTDFPFIEEHIKENIFLREFKESVESEELKWHMDQEDREVKIIESNGWKLQLDNQLPILLEEGKTYFIEKYNFHRVIKGSGNLIVEVKKLLDK